MGMVLQGKSGEYEAVNNHIDDMLDMVIYDVGYAMRTFCKPEWYAVRTLH